MFKTPLLCGAFAAVILAVTVPEPPPAGAETLEQALVAAYTSNPTLLAQRKAVRAADELVPQALSGWRPTVQIEADIGKEWRDTKGMDTDTDVDDAVDPIGTVTLTPATGTLSVVQPLYRGGRTVAGTRRAENLVRAERARLDEVEQTVLLDAVTAYMDVVRDQAVLDLAESNEEVLRRQLEAVRARFEVGDVTGTDVAQAEARLASATAERIAAAGALMTSRAAYLEVIGTMPGTLTAPAPPADVPASDEEAFAIAAAEQPALLRAQFAERAARDDVRVAVGDLLPELSLRGRLSRSEEPSTFLDRRDEASITAELTIPLYQAGLAESQVREARETAAQRRLEVEARRREVMEGVARAWQDLITAQARIEALNEAVRAARIALEGVEQEAAVGARTTLDVLDTEEDLFEAEVDLARARRDAVVAGYALKAAVGRLTARALDLPVTLYDVKKHYGAVRGEWWGLDAGMAE